jgi:hypothetical protein
MVSVTDPYSHILDFLEPHLTKDSEIMYGNKICNYCQAVMYLFIYIYIYACYLFFVFFF